MIVYSKRNVRVAELHFDENGQIPKGVDVVRFRSHPEKMSGPHSSVFHTLFTDLDGDGEALLARMQKTTRNLIRQASRSNEIAFEFNAAPDVGWTGEFLDFYGRFAQAKGLPEINRERIRAMQASGVLVLSRVAGGDGSPLVWHCYVRSGKWVRLLHSASLFRSADKEYAALIAKANRYQHWQDMIRFRGMQVDLYDFGGWYSGSEDQEKLRINQFKESFGGRVVQVFNTDRGVTWKGALILNGRRALDRLRGRSDAS